MPRTVISYSRDDQAIVRPLVKLLRADAEFSDAVFWDDDLQAGVPWFEQVQKKIEESNKLFVFWCEHAAESTEVRREFLYAFELQKIVIPVLMDDTPLAPELAHIHGVDLRELRTHRAGVRIESPDEDVVTISSPNDIERRDAVGGGLTVVTSAQLVARFRPLSSPTGMGPRKSFGRGGFGRGF